MKIQLPQAATQGKVSRVQVSLSKNVKTARQKFLGALMRETSGDNGDALAQAFARGNTDHLRELLGELTENLIRKSARK